MAGILKPNVPDLGEEASARIITSSVLGSAHGLFDEVSIDAWESPQVAYWQTPSNYIEIEFYSDVNIWRSGTTSWASYTSKFNISKLVDGQYVDITSHITQNVSEIKDNEWEKTIDSLEAGIYKFSSPSYRIDSEWYLEVAYIRPRVKVKRKCFERHLEINDLVTLDKSCTQNKVKVKLTNQDTLEVLYRSEDFISLTSNNMLVLDIPLDHLALNTTHHLQLCLEDEQSKIGTDTFKVFMANDDFIVYDKSIELKAFTVPDNTIKAILTTQSQNNIPIGVAYSSDNVYFSLSPLEDYMDVSSMSKLYIKLFMPKNTQLKAYGIGWMSEFVYANLLATLRRLKNEDD